MLHHRFLGGPKIGETENVLENFTRWGQIISHGATLHLGFDKMQDRKLCHLDAFFPNVRAPTASQV
jgi:hypothetical protein